MNLKNNRRPIHSSFTILSPLNHSSFVIYLWAVRIYITRTWSLNYWCEAQVCAQVLVQLREVLHFFYPSWSVKCILLYVRQLECRVPKADNWGETKSINNVVGYSVDCSDFSSQLDVKYGLEIKDSDEHCSFIQYLLYITPWNSLISIIIKKNSDWFYAIPHFKIYIC